MARLITVTLATLATFTFAALGVAQEEVVQVGLGTPVAWTVEGTPAAAANTVSIVDTEDSLAFEPMDRTVKVGTTVIWENLSAAGEGHSVVSTTGGVTLMDPDGPVLFKGEGYSHTFDKEGTVSYECGVHPDMDGNIIVTP